MIVGVNVGKNAANLATSGACVGAQSRASAGDRRANRVSGLMQRALHQAREQTLAHYRWETINRPNPFRLALREGMHLRLHNLDSAVSSRRDSAAHQHALAARQIAAHVGRQVEPHDANLSALHVEPSRREPPPSRTAHRPLGYLAKVAFDDDHLANAQLVGRRSLPPILVAHWKMKNKIGSGNDAAGFQSCRPLRPDPSHRSNEVTFWCLAQYFTEEVR